MRYLELSPGDMRMRDGTPTARPAGWARVRVTACGVCRTDVHLLEGMVLPRGASYPVRPGHEVAGVVVEADASSPVGVGQPVVLHPLAGCRRCDGCRSGLEQRCRAPLLLGMGTPGGFAEEVVWPADRMVGAGGLRPTYAAVLADAVATAYHALDRAELDSAGALCVIGAGGVGANVLRLARALHPDVRLVAVVRRPASAAMVAPLADLVVTGLKDAHRQVRKELGPVDAVVEFSGAEDAPGEAFRMLRAGGTLVVGAIRDEPFSLGTTLTGLAAREIAVVGSYVSTLDELRTVTELAASGRLDLSGSVAATYPLGAAADAVLALAERGPGPSRFVVVPEEAADE